LYASHRFAPRRAARRRARATVWRTLFAALFLGLPLASAAQEPAVEPASPAAEPAVAQEPEASFFDATTVTATGSERNTFQVATPVTVITEQQIERLAPDNAASLLREQPGVDVNGVGPNQARPVIRGQRGLRVLFLEDGLRLNNARRQTDFGEISGLVDLDSIATVEVVRGPASVLYGSDAIGGVLNLVTRPPRFTDERRFQGGVELRYGSAAGSERASANIAGTGGRWEWQLGATTRSADDYDAPSGSFGEIDLDGEPPVLDTGIDDDSLWGSVGYAIDDRHSLRLRFNRYRADQTGFGLVEPEAYGVDEAFRIRILYPFQEFDRWTLSYFGTALESALADSVDARAYWQSNERELVNDIDIDIGPVFPGAPSSSVASDTRNFTDLDTRGVRLEAIKGLGAEHLLTYGFEGFEDDSFNTDFSRTTTTFRFPFPPSVIGVIPGFTCVDFVPPFECAFTDDDAVANAPNAENSSWGVFAQDEWTAGAKLRVTGGLRYQKVATKAEPTPGWEIAGLDFDDDALVGAVTATWQLLPELNLLASYGTAFRAPSLIERLFNGLTPEGIGYQILNPGLQSESSDNFDLGLKYRRANAFLELVLFRSEVDDGIVQYTLSDAEIAQLPQEVQDEIAANQVDFVVQQRNAERLRYEGIELAVGYRTASGWVFGGNYTYLDEQRLDSNRVPVGDTYGDKLAAYVRWEPASRPLWVEYRVRHNASTAANLDPAEPVPPVGTTLPSFTVHTLAGGGTVHESGRFAHEVRLAIENLTDELYAEYSNATFFRPEPGRNVTASYRLRF
jgi:hemoglobin/transferrin/lactoferrin receptor protein